MNAHRQTPVQGESGQTPVGQKPKLLRQVREALRAQHYSRHTETTYTMWVKRYIQRSVKAAVRRAGITKHVTPHTFRHSFATHLLEDGYDIRAVQSRTCGIGHKDVRTTMIYPAGAGLNRGGSGVRSPEDGL